jgi:hypothetical protein
VCDFETNGAHETPRLLESPSFFGTAFRYIRCAGIATTDVVSAGSDLSGVRNVGGAVTGPRSSVPRLDAILRSDVLAEGWHFARANTTGGSRDHSWRVALYGYRFGSAVFDESRFELEVAGRVVETPSRKHWRARSEIREHPEARPHGSLKDFENS